MLTPRFDLSAPAQRSYLELVACPTLALREAAMHRERARAVEALRGMLDRPAVVSLIVSCALLILFLGFALGQLFGQVHQAGRSFKFRV